MWYVVQVPTGREEYMCRLIRRVAEELGSVAERDSEVIRCDERVLGECFIPTCAFERKRRGEWHTVRLPLFPGYVVVDSRDVDALDQMLRRVPEFTLVLKMGDAFTPLDPAEVTWIKTFSDPETHSVEMSVGVMEGDKVHVMSGPLKGHEGEIKEVNRRKGVALLEVHMFGRTMTAKVGLAIVAKRNGSGQLDNNEGDKDPGNL